MTARPAAWSSGDLRPAARPTSAARPAAPRTATSTARRCAATASSRSRPARSATSGAPPVNPGALPHVVPDSNPCTEDRLMSAGTCARQMCAPADHRVASRRRLLPPTPAATPRSIPTAPPSAATASSNRRPRPATARRPALVSGPGGLSDERSARPTSCGAPPPPATPPASPMPITACANGDGCCRPAAAPPTTSTARRSAATASSTATRPATARSPPATRAPASHLRRPRRLHGRPRLGVGRRVHAHLHAPPLTACVTGDGCCPPGCTGATRHRLSRRTCGDGRVERAARPAIPRPAARPPAPTTATRAPPRAGGPPALQRSLRRHADHRVRGRRRLLPAGLLHRQRQRLPADLRQRRRRHRRELRPRHHRRPPGRVPQHLRRRRRLHRRPGLRVGRGLHANLRPPVRHRLPGRRRLLPTGCTGVNDADCAPRCDDGRIGAGETCDPPTPAPPPARTTATPARPSS